MRCISDGHHTHLRPAASSPPLHSVAARRVAAAAKITSSATRARSYSADGNCAYIVYRLRSAITRTMRDTRQ